MLSVWVWALARWGNGRFRLSQSSNIKTLLIIFLLLKIHLLVAQELRTLNYLCLLATDPKHRNSQELLLISICSGSSWCSKWILNLIHIVSCLLLLIGLLLMKALLGKFVTIEHMLAILLSIIAFAVTISGWGSLDHFVAHCLLRLWQLIMLLMSSRMVIRVVWFAARSRSSTIHYTDDTFSMDDLRAV